MNIGQKNFQEWAAEWLCRHRRSWPNRWAGQASYLLWRAYENRNFQMNTNGEDWLLQQLATLKNASCVFDVGANLGDWIQSCRRHLPHVTIHAFEIAPPNFLELQKNVSHLDNLVLNATGLSDKNDEIEIFYSETSHYLTTAYKEHLGAAYAVPGTPAPTAPKSLRVPVIRGDDYVRRQGVETIDMLKIDVEGMEGSVLNGLRETFSRRRIRVVQFEYNTTNIVSKFLLRDAYDFFTRLDYRVGKLYPNYVEFRDYNYRHEDFCGPNMVAVRQEDTEALKLLGSAQ